MPMLGPLLDSPVSHKRGTLWLECTCTVAPEQYDVYDRHNHQVGYIRLRSGIMRVDTPDAGGDTIFAKMFTDMYKSAFDDAKERSTYLNTAVRAIRRQTSKQQGVNNGIEPRTSTKAKGPKPSK